MCWQLQPRLVRFCFSAIKYGGGVCALTVCVCVCVCVRVCECVRV